LIARRLAGPYSKPSSTTNRAAVLSSSSSKESLLKDMVFDVKTGTSRRRICARRYQKDSIVSLARDAN
jgi:hypothetical protein